MQMASIEIVTYGGHTITIVTFCISDAETGKIYSLMEIEIDNRLSRLKLNE